jgi:hypothetical protein
MPDENPYGYQIRTYIRRYSEYGQPRDLEAARALMVTMAIDRGLTAYDVEAMTTLVAQA